MHFAYFQPAHSFDASLGLKTRRDDLDHPAFQDGPTVSVGTEAGEKLRHMGGLALVRTKAEILAPIGACVDISPSATHVGKGDPRTARQPCSGQAPRGVLFGAPEFLHKID